MKWQIVRQVLVREVRDQMRDRRTLFMIFVLPLLLYPLLGMSLFNVLTFVREQPTRVLVLGFHESEGYPDLIRTDADGTQHFADELFDKVESVRVLKIDRRELDPKTEAISTEAAAAAEKEVQDGSYEAVVYFPPDFNDKLQTLRSELDAADATNSEPAADRAKELVPSPEIFYNASKEKSQLAFVRLREVLHRWSDAIGRQNLASRNLPETTAKPFEFANKDIAEKGQREAALWSKILPFLLLIWALTGAFYPAIDLCAGEKERGTLETLLSSPAERIEIVWGKLLTVMLFSVLTAVLNILSMGVTGSIVMGGMAAGGASHMSFGPPPPLAPIWLVIALLPMSAMFSALCIALASFARSTKEGQYYLMPLVLVTMPLVILPMAPGVELNLGMSLIPVTGVVLLLKMMLEGHYWEVLRYMLPVVAVTGSCCLLAIRWAVDQFNSENVLFRDSERGGIGSWFRHLLRDREDTPNPAGAVLCGVLILITYFFFNMLAGRLLGPMESIADFAKQAIATQLVVILLPVGLMTIITTRSPRQTLLITKPSLWSIPAALALAAALHPTAMLLQDLLTKLYPLNPDYVAAFTKLSKMLEQNDSSTIWIIFGVMACLPAVCEELAFRGYILSGLRKLGHPKRAILLSSLFFGMAHGAAVQQAINAAILGCLIGYIAIQTSSIFPGMAFHVAHNGILVVFVGWLRETLKKDSPWKWVADIGTETDPHLIYHPLIIAAGIVVAGGLIRWFSRLPRHLSYEEELNEAIQEHREHVAA